MSLSINLTNSAFRNGYISVAALLNAKADPNPTGYGRLTPLQLAAQMQSQIPFLLEQDRGYSLFLAFYKKQFQVAQNIIELKANTDIVDQRGWSIRSFVVMYNLTDLMSSVPDNPYSREFVRRKRLAHVCGLKGASQISNIQFSLEGARAEYMHSMIAHSLKKFYRVYFPEPKQLICAAIIAAFKRASVQRCEQMLTYDVFHYDPVIIPAGWDGHSIDVVFYKNYLAICNLGDGVPGNCSTIEVFKIKREIITTNDLEDILDQDTKEEAIPFFYEELPQVLSPNEHRLKDSFCIAASQLAPKKSKGGHCSFGCGKGALRFLEWAMRVDPDSPELFNDMREKAIAQVKFWSLYLQIETLASDLQAHMKVPQKEFSMDLGEVIASLEKIHKRFKKVPSLYMRELLFKRLLSLPFATLEPN